MLRLYYGFKKYLVLSLLLFLTVKAFSKEELKKLCYPPSAHDEYKNLGKQMDLWHVEIAARLMVRPCHFFLCAPQSSSPCLFSV